MSEAFLTQLQADALIAMEKRCAHADPIDYPEFGGHVAAPLLSSDGRENFLLDVHRSKIDLRKGTNQLRAHQAIVLVRLDFGGRPHRNPDDEEISSPHIHIYREGFGDKWALRLPDGIFRNIEDHWKTLEDFMAYCRVIEPPNFRRGLFA